MKIDAKDLAKIRKYFKKQPTVAAVYLYGSFAKGEAKKDSDIDLGIVFLRKKKREQPFLLPQLVFADELTKILKRKVEIQDLDDCSLSFAYRVISEGKVLVGKEASRRVEFEVDVMRRYFDLQNFYQEYEKQIAHLAGKGVLDARPFAY